MAHMYGFTNTALVEKGGQKHAVGRSRGGITTKMHWETREVQITPGNINGSVQAPELLASAKDQIIIGDKGYDSDKIIKVHRRPWSAGRHTTYKESS